MSPITWLSREETVALGWTLLHFCWQGTAVAVAYAAVDRITARATSKVRYFVALSALLLMPAVVIGTFAEELRVATPTHITGDATNIVYTAPSGITPLLHELPLASSLEQPTEWLATRTDSMLPWVDAIWFVGVLFLALRSLGGWWQLALVRRHAQRMIPVEIERAFLRLCEQIEVGRKVALRASDEVISPLAMGVWRATVILPISAVLSLPREELEAVIAHELGHIRRWDYLWNLLQTAIESLLFFHPAVWWISRTVRDRREICCDEIAVRTCSDAAIYARALLRLEEQRTVKLRLAMAIGGCGGSLLTRIRKVLGEDMAMEGNMTSGVSVATIGALVLTLLLGPKIGEAVASPAATHPTLTHAMATLPEAVVSQFETPKAPLVLPTPAVVTIYSVPPTPAVVTTHTVGPAPKHLSAVRPAPAPTATPAILKQLPAPATSFHLVVLRSTTVHGSFAIQTSTTSTNATSYMQGMKDAGYPLDLDNNFNELVALKSMGITPEYAKSMGSTSLGKPSVHDLISLKSMGVTPDYLASLNQGNIAPKSFHEVITEKSMGITPDYAVNMRKAFGDLDVHDLVTMKSMGVTPEYATDMKKGFNENLSAHELVTTKSMGVTPEYATEMKKAFGENLTVHELVATKSMGVTPEYAAQMKQAGIGNLTVHELIAMKSQGMTPEYAGWLKQHFPNATPEQLHRAAVFHLDDKFLADARAHGFTDNNLDKLLRLKMSGLLSDNN